MSDSSVERNPVEILAEEFVERHRRGERPSLHEYTDKHPQWADQIRELFPALVMMEKLKPATADVTGSIDTSPELPRGKKLERLGDYRILREVGRGGMGIVYEAEQVSLGRHVALKVLPAHSLLDARHLQRFEREAKAAARLHHTNIVPVYGVGQDDGIHYYVMQFIQGQGVDQVLRELRRLRQDRRVMSTEVPETSPASPLEANGGGAVSALAVARSLLTGHFTLTETAHGEADGGGVATLLKPPRIKSPRGEGSEGSSSSIVLPGQSDPSQLTESGKGYWQSVARVGCQIAQALAYANSQGIVHRDIKPSNLLLDSKGIVWVTDFGLAKSTDQDNLTLTGDILGTLRYMPPERFTGHGDARSDIYSLGLTLYELLTLRPAYDESDRNRLIQSVAHEEPPRPRKVNPAIPRDLETIVLKAVARDPAQRYQTAAAVADDLQRFLEDLPIQARRVSARERFYRWCRRNKALAGLSAAVVALLATVALVSSVMAVRLGKAAANAKQAADEAQAAATREAEAAGRERDQARRAQGLVGQQFVQNGTRLLEQGDVSGAAIWYAEALKNDDQADKDRSEQHRWRLAMLLRQCPRPAQVWFHDGTVNLAAFSFDGKRMLTVSDKTVQVWEVASGKPAGPPLQHKTAVTQALFSQDGETVVTYQYPDATFDDGGNPAGSSGEILFWDVSRGTQRAAPARFWFGMYPVHSHHNVYVAIAKDHPADQVAGRVQVFVTATGQPASPPLETPGEYVYGAAFSPDARWLLTVSQGMPSGDRIQSAVPATYQNATYFRIWDVQTAEVLHTHVVSQAANVGAGWGFEFSSDGRWFQGMSADGVVRQWDVHTGQLVHSFAKRMQPYATSLFSPNARYLMAASHGNVSGAGWQFSALGHLGHVGIGALGVGGQSWPAQSFPLPSLGYGPVYSPPMLDAMPLQTAVSWDLWGRGSVYGTSLGLSSGGFGMVHVFDTATGKPLGASFEGSVYMSRFSPDSRRVLTVDREGMPRIVDVHTGQPLTPPLKHDRAVMRAEFSPDGRYLLTVSQDNAVRIWDATRGKLIAPVFKHENEVTQALFSPDGSHVLTVSGKTVRLWPVATPLLDTLVLKHEHTVSQFLLSPDGSRVLTVTFEASEIPTTDFGNTVARLWDAGTGKLIGQPLELEGYLDSTQFTSDSRRVLFKLQPLGSPGEIDAIPYGESTWRAWNPVSGVLVKPEPTAETKPGMAGSMFLSLLFSPDGRYAVATYQALYPQPSGVANPGGVRVWDTSTGKEIAPKIQPEGTVQYAFFSPDSRRVVITSYQNQWGFLRTLAPRFLARWASPACLTGALANPNTLLSILDSSQRFGMWESKTVSAIELWDVATGKSVGSALSQHKHALYPQVLMSDDGKRMLTFVVSSDPSGLRAVLSEINLWDAETGELIRPLKLTASAGLHPPQTLLKLSPDGRYLLSVNGEYSRTTQAVQVWDTSEDKPLTPPLPHEGAVTTALFSRDSRVVMTVCLDSVLLWDVATGKTLVPPLKHDWLVTEAHFSEDGRRIFTFSAPSNPYAYDPSIEVRVWDAATGQPLSPAFRSRRWSPNFATSVPTGPLIFSRNGERMVLMTDENTVEVCDLSADRRDVAALLELTQVLGSRVVNGSSIQPLKAEEFQAGWRTITHLYGADWKRPALSGPAWHRQQVQEFQGLYRGDAFAALWHLDRLLQPEPEKSEKPAYLLARASAHAQLRQWDRAIADFSRVIGEGKDSTWLLMRGHAHAQLGHWKEAAADFTQAVDQQKQGVSPGLAPLALLRLHEKDLAGYREICTKIIAMVPEPGRAYLPFRATGYGLPEFPLGGLVTGLEFRPLSAALEAAEATLFGTSDARLIVSSQVGLPRGLEVWPVLLSPDHGQSLTELLRTVESGSIPYHSFLGEAWLAGLDSTDFPLLAAIYYRLGRYQDTVNSLLPQVASETAATAPQWLFLAMARKELGNDQEAKDSLAKGIAAIREGEVELPAADSLFSLSTWQTPLIEKLLLQEAKDLINGKEEKSP